MLLLLTSPIFGAYDWADAGVGIAMDEATGIATDQLGNTYVVGNFTGASKSFTTTSGTVTISSSGGSMDFFVIKYLAGGAIEWVRGFGGTGIEEVYRVSTATNGLIAIVGAFSSTTLSIPGLAGLPNTGGLDGFLLVMNEAGNPVWIRGVGGAMTDRYLDVHMTETSIVAVGSMTSSFAMLGGSPLANLGAAGSSDILVAKYDLDGNVEWRFNYGGTGDEQANGVAVNGNKVYMAGSWAPIFAGPLTMGGASSGVSYGGADAFCAAFEILNGSTFHWVRNVGGATTDRFDDVTTDKSGGVYCHGTSSSPVFSNGPSVETNSGSSDLYILKFREETGASLWMRHPIGSTADEARAIEADDCGNIYITGFFGSAGLSFGPGILPSGGTNNIYFASYDAAGILISGTTFLNSGNALGNDVAIDFMHNPAVVGRHVGTLTVGGLGSIPNLGTSHDFLIVHRNDIVPTDWHHTSFATVGKAKGVDVAVDSHGDIYATGTFSGTTMLGEIGASVTLPGEGMYVAKYSSCGKLLWAAQTNTEGLDSRAITIDEKNGWVYVCGNRLAGSPATYGSGISPDGETCIIGATSLAGPTSYITRYRMSDGCLTNYRVFSSATRCNAIDVDHDGNVYVGQEFDLGIYQYIRVMKLNDNLATVWDHQSSPVVGGNTKAWLNDIVVEYAADNALLIYATGSFSGMLNISPLLVTALSSAQRDAYVWQLTDGAPHTSNWLSQASTSFFAEGMSITTDQDANAYVIGSWKGNLVLPFGAAAVAGSTTVSSAFVGKLEAASGGLATWVTPIKTIANSVYGTGISGDRSGLYLTGYWHGGDVANPLVFPASQGIAPLAWLGDPDPLKHHFYQARYNYNNTPGGTWGNTSIGLDFHRSYGIAANNASFVYTTGEYKDLMTMIPTFLTSTVGMQDAFLVRTRSDGGIFMKTAPIAEVLTESVPQNGLTVYPNPSTGIFEIRFADGLNGTVQVTDLQGKILLGKTTLDGQSQLVLDHLPKGVYILNWISEKGQRGSRKLILQ